MEYENKSSQQYDVNRVPRFANIATFMRSKYVESAEGLDIAMAGIPFDLGSSFRSGARHGPSQIREMSRLIRQVHPVSKIEPFKLFNVADVGDAPINPLDLIESLDLIKDFFDTIAASGAKPLAVGGDHTVTLPVLRSLARYAPFGLLQIDAHSDTLDEMLGKKYANGTPVRRAVEEGLVDPERIVQIGIRGTLFKADEFEWAREQGITIITIDEFYENGIQKTIGMSREKFGSDPVYITFDIDSLDPAYAPGAGGLEPGGLSVREAQLILRGMYGLNLIGADVNEVSPPLDPTGNTALVAANIMFEELCLLVDTLKRQ
jgi:guanidinopropionase